jgi:uncharacterized protein
MIKITIEGKEINYSRYVSEDILLDTNILVFAHHKGSQYHSKASCILLASLQGSIRACISGQNLLELFSVMSNPRKVKPTPSSSDVSRICSDLKLSRNIRKIFPNEIDYKEAIEFAGEKALRGPQIFDCLLAITARQNQIDRIWTDNVSDFRNFEESITIENPLLMNWAFEAEKKRD